MTHAGGRPKIRIGGTERTTIYLTREAYLLAKEHALNVSDFVNRSIMARFSNKDELELSAIDEEEARLDVRKASLHERRIVLQAKLQQDSKVELDMRADRLIDAWLLSRDLRAGSDIGLITRRITLDSRKLMDDLASRRISRDADPEAFLVYSPRIKDGQLRRVQKEQMLREWREKEEMK